MLSQHSTRHPLPHPTSPTHQDDEDELSEGADDDDDDDEEDDTNINNEDNDEDSHLFLPESSESITPFKTPTYSQNPWTEMISVSNLPGWIANRYEEGTWNKHETRVGKDRGRESTEDPATITIPRPNPMKPGRPPKFLSVTEYRCTWSGKHRPRDSIPKTSSRRARMPSTKVGCKAKFYVKEMFGIESREVRYHWKHTGHDPTCLSEALRARASQLPPSLRAIRPQTRKSNSTSRQGDLSITTRARVGTNPDMPSRSTISETTRGTSSSMAGSPGFQHTSSSPLLDPVLGLHQSLTIESPRSYRATPTKRRRIDGSEDVFAGAGYASASVYGHWDEDHVDHHHHHHHHRHQHQDIVPRNHRESRTNELINDDHEEFLPMEEAETPVDTTPFLPTFTPVRGTQRLQLVDGSSRGLPIPFLSSGESHRPPTFAGPSTFLHQPVSGPAPTPAPVPVPHFEPIAIPTSSQTQTPSILDTQDTLSLLRTIRRSHESSGKTLELLTRRLIQEGSRLDDGRLKEVMRRTAERALVYGAGMSEWAIEEGL